ncbi:preprotein translocase subunit SecE [Candidatus Saccharibacteria bacterium]|nr:preprotein translocase subunit SecE [Candidatus Saccharibacteria bacterium]
MAQSSESKRRPRIRKSAPTVRELAEAARVKDEVKPPRRISKLLAKPAAPVKKIGSSRPAKIAARPFRWLGKGLAWLAPKYVVNSWRELRQVHWPSRRETWRLTLAVFIFAIVFGSLVAGVDRGLDELFKKVVLK